MLERKQKGKPVRTADVIVIGAGVFGLSVGLAVRRAGLGVLVLDANTPGSGASGGPVGALCPHAPTKWRPFKQFQLDALLTLEAHVARLEAETGLGTGYARCGRLTPLLSDRAVERARAEADGAHEIWGDRARFELIDAPSSAIVPPPECAGWVHETLSARISPPAYLRALAAALGEAVVPGAHVVGLDAAAGTVSTATDAFAAQTIVVAAGWQGWPLLAPLQAGLQGMPVKGQAAALQASMPGPLVYADGFYAIGHDDGTVAVGSTSEKTFAEPYGTDDQLDDLIGRARALCPHLRDAPVVRRWAGLRPKPPGREPVVGPVDDVGRVWAAMGGFKIGFGIAHLVGDAVAAGIVGTAPRYPVPQTFLPSAHRQGVDTA